MAVTPSLNNDNQTADIVLIATLSIFLLCLFDVSMILIRYTSPRSEMNTRGLGDSGQGNIMMNAIIWPKLFTVPPMAQTIYCDGWQNCICLILTTFAWTVVANWSMVIGWAHCYAFDKEKTTTRPSNYFFTFCCCSIHIRKGSDIINYKFRNKTAVF